MNYKEEFNGLRFKKYKKDILNNILFKQGQNFMFFQAHMWNGEKFLFDYTNFAFRADSLIYYYKYQFYAHIFTLVRVADEKAVLRIHPDMFKIIFANATKLNVEAVIRN